MKDRKHSLGEASTELPKTPAGSRDFLISMLIFD